jgi:hypothetical protein
LESFKAAYKIYNFRKIIILVRIYILTIGRLI